MDLSSYYFIQKNIGNALAALLCVCMLSLPAHSQTDASANLAALNRLTKDRIDSIGQQLLGGDNRFGFLNNLINIANGPFISKTLVAQGGFDGEVTFYTNLIYSIADSLDGLNPYYYTELEQKLSKQRSIQSKALMRNIQRIHQVMQHINDSNGRLRRSTYGEFRQKVRAALEKDTPAKATMPPYSLKQLTLEPTPPLMIVPTARPVIAPTVQPIFEPTLSSMIGSTKRSIPEPTPSLTPFDFEADKREADRRAAARAEFARRQQKTPTQEMKEYIQNSRIINMYVGNKWEEMANVMRQALTEQIDKNSGKWPGVESLKVTEQFYWNLNGSLLFDNSKGYIKTLFSTRIYGNWGNFIDFCALYLERLNNNEKSRAMYLLVPIYLAFPEEEQRQAFMGFCDPYVQRLENNIKLYTMNILLPIYQTFPDERKRQAFMDFCANYITDETHYSYRLKIMTNLLLIHQAFLTENERNIFIDFCKQYLKEKKSYEILDIAKAFLPIHQAFSNESERDVFMHFCEPYFGETSGIGKARIMQELLPIYNAFSNEEREAFMDVCKGRRASETLEAAKTLLPIYQTFLNKSERDTFMFFFEQHFEEVDLYNKIKAMQIFSPIYNAFLNDREREAFIDFCKPYIKREPHDKYNIMRELLPIYNAFSNEERDVFINFCQTYIEENTPKNHHKKNIERNEIKVFFSIYKDFSNKTERERFMGFCKLYFSDIDSFYDRLAAMPLLLSIYKAIPKIGERDTFMDFCKPHLKDLHLLRRLDIIKALIPIYQSKKIESFNLFAKIYDNRNQNDIYETILSYISRDYLRYIRVDSALKAEAINQRRHQPMYETELNDQLPVFWAEDPFLNQAQAMANAAANAHDFDEMYEKDRPILWKKTAAPVRSLNTHTIYNNEEVQKGYRTNIEVDDFINYLETDIATHVGFKRHGITLSGPDVVRVIKQILGLQNVRKDFEPYLSSPMYFQKPQSPTGDEMLGRTWAYMKGLSNDPKTMKSNKESVVGALLNAVELSINPSGNLTVHMHCQTRTSGDLFKMLAWYLEGSAIRALIAAPDSVGTSETAIIEKRIAEAPINAKIMFDGIKDEGVGEIRQLFERCNNEGRSPELWEQYEAYYDTLYGRKKVTEGTPYNQNIHIRLPDGRMYMKNEHILERDDRGNLVSMYNADGTPRDQPVIIYYQAEFQVLEHIFTKLMKREFEDQRGLKY